MIKQLKNLLAIALLGLFIVPAVQAAGTDITAAISINETASGTYVRETWQENSGFPFYDWETQYTWSKDRQWWEWQYYLKTNTWSTLFKGTRNYTWEQSNSELEYEWIIFEDQYRIVLNPYDVEERGIIWHYKKPRNQSGYYVYNNYTTYSLAILGQYRLICDDDASDEEKQPVVGEADQTLTWGSDRVVIDHGNSSYVSYEVDLTNYLSTNTILLELWGKNVITGSLLKFETVTTTGGSKSTHLFGILNPLSNHAVYDYYLLAFLQ